MNYCFFSLTQKITRRDDYWLTYGLKLTGCFQLHSTKTLCKREHDHYYWLNKCYWLKYKTYQRDLEREFASELSNYYIIWSLMKHNQREAERERERQSVRCFCANSRWYVLDLIICNFQHIALAGCYDHDNVCSTAVPVRLVCAALTCRLSAALHIIPVPHPNMKKYDFTFLQAIEAVRRDLHLWYQDDRWVTWHGHISLTIFFAPFYHLIIIGQTDIINDKDLCCGDGSTCFPRKFLQQWHFFV